MIWELWKLKKLSALEALERLKHFQIGNPNGCLILWDKKEEDINLIEKELKALEIIKEKSVNVYVFQHSGDLETYNDMVDSEDRKLNAKEYDLLKEVLYV